MTPMTSPYKMKLDLRVLEHLGINLYSNAAAVLSEAVANSWDADAEAVQITISDEEIIIDDDGIGMSLKHINERFLAVGYDKRAEEGELSGKVRRFMGRKGIGKLALFSIADTIEVHTRRAGERHAFRMQAEKIKDAIKNNQTYFPEPISFLERAKGTRIVLHRLKKQRTARSASALRKRIARRFSIIGREGRDGDRFYVQLNGELIGSDDREDLKAVEFLWEFGHDPELKTSACPSLRNRFTIRADVDERHPDWVVRGWLGAVARPQKLRHDEAGSLHGIVVLARGRLIQENLLDKLNFSRILGSYLTGQVEADFLDLPGEADIATSDRQRLVEDDERYMALVRFLRSALLSISDQWTSLRNEARAAEALSESPALTDWLDTLPEGQRKAAARLVGLIRGVELEHEEDRADLYRSGIAAFERLRLREESDRLVETTELTAAHLLPLLSDLATLEGSLYREIVRSRLDVIKLFEDLVDANEKEKLLQRHLFDNLWLLDPGWERAAGSERIEQILKKDFREFYPSLSDRESKGRVDIRYRTNAGEHIIVELKKARRRLHLSDLLDQGQKYLGALRRCLVSAGFEAPHISIVFVVGQPLHEEGTHGREWIAQTLRPSGARVIHYETLIRGAHDAYAEYLQRTRESDRLDQILRRL
jgi:hypothetical protein